MAENNLPLLGLSQPAQTGDVSVSAREDAFDKVPAPLLERFGEPVLVIELELSSDRKLAREDVNKVMTHLRTRVTTCRCRPVATAHITEPRLYHGNLD